MFDCVGSRKRRTGGGGGGGSRDGLHDAYKTTLALSSKGCSEVGEEKLYGDDRILRRLPKHVRSLRRHIYRLLANSRALEGGGGGGIIAVEAGLHQLSESLKKEFSSLEMVL